MDQRVDDSLAFARGAASPAVLGADYDGEGTNFAIFSENAERVELCLYDAEGRTEIARLDMPEMEGGVWFGYLPGVRSGQAYGYRVHGPYEPEAGHRFNPAKLLLDPYARQLTGSLEWNDALFGYRIGEDDTSFDDRDSAPFMPKAVVAEPDFDWSADRVPSTPWERTVIYEAHVRGMTMLHPGVPEDARGTFEGLASEPVIDHLKALGITAIELLPVHGFVQDQHLLEKGLRNYWGYNTLSFFAPYRPYLKSGRPSEIKSAVRRFHDAGIEVILDVVYNHTAEGNEMGPTLSFRGIDNSAYYLLSPDNPRHSFDTTGCGNTLNIAHPMVLRMVLDSLRYWVEVMHVDGFRFDLASTLGRESTGFEREGAFMNAIRQDPVLSRVKLIAEPWDIGDGGYQVGGFPWPFREWNDKARDDMRAYWRRDPGLHPRLAQRLLGSPRQFHHSHRPATSSVNFLAAHDGFTLWDCLSYDGKHNEANGEDNADGHDNNLSHNMGTEGPTGDEAIHAARLRRAKAMLGTLLMSQGVPMILAGDELGHSQGGNNNAYCQDNEISWIDWASADPTLTCAVADLVALRRDLDLAHPRFAVDPAHGDGVSPEIAWLHPAGRRMEDGDWSDHGLQVFGAHRFTAEGGEVLTWLNAGDDATCTLPEGDWTLVLVTSEESISRNETVSGDLTVPGQSVAVLRR
ncbi:glycogen debranching protein GlgX [Rhodobacterales bacterium HKCCE2091]|nr:glycogen debranching protein GlgX [Rhodobacterales bacterium HKCCE2091]